jgi:hypothetical protein
MHESAAELELEWTAAVADGTVEQLKALLIDVDAAVVIDERDRKPAPV